MPTRRGGGSVSDRRGAESGVDLIICAGAYAQHGHREVIPLPNEAACQNRSRSRGRGDLVV